jgi:HEAT repeats
MEGQTGGAEEWAGDALPIAEVRSLFVTLGKAFRAYQLYDENNPVRQRFIEALRDEFTKVWGTIDRLVLRVDEDRIYLGDSEVYKAENRADSLAFLFFKDGVREITFAPGIGEHELEAFLSVLHRARKLAPEGDDLLTVLWEQDLNFFEYQYVDLLAEGVSVPVAGEGNSQEDLKAVLQAEAEGEEDAAAPESGERGAAEEKPSPQTVNKDDFNPTLYALDPREMELLRGELQKELSRDLRRDVLAALFDRLEEPGNRERQSEIIDIFATLLPSFLSKGVLGGATMILQELRRLEDTEGVFDEERLAASRALVDEVSSREAIEELIQALYDGSIRTSPASLGEFLQFMRGGALLPLLRAVETVDHKELQAVLRSSVQGIANQNRGAVVDLLTEADPVVASGAARLVGDMQIAEAGPALADLLAHPDPGVRLAAVEATVSLKASTAAGALEFTLEDPDRDVRIAAARALGELQYRPAAASLEAALKSKEIRSADISEKVAFFEAYGMVAGDEAVDLLDGLLNGKGFLGKKAPAEIRGAAALGLGRIGNQAARSALQKATRDDDPVVRSNVNRALKTED